MLKSSRRSEIVISLFDAKASLDLECDDEADPKHGSHLRSYALGGLRRPQAERLLDDKGDVDGSGLSGIRTSSA